MLVRWEVRVPRKLSDVGSGRVKQGLDDSGESECGLCRRSDVDQDSTDAA